MESYISVIREGGKVWKDYMERIMNEENDWDHNVEEGALVCVSRENMLQVLNENKKSPMDLQKYH